MDYKIQIKEEDTLTDDIASENEREFLQNVVSMNTNTDADCDMTDKTELISENHFIKHFIKQIKTETAACSNNWEIDRANEVKQQTLFSDIASQNGEELLPENPVIMDKEYNSDNEMCNKIEIKVEPWQLETETSSVWENTKDVDFTAVKSSRFSPEIVAGAIPGKLPLLSAEVQARDTSLYEGMDHFEFEHQKSNVTEILTEKEVVHSKKYGKCSDQENMYIQSLYLKSKSFSNVSKRQQCRIRAKTFSSLSYLKVHILIHEGKKPRQCKVCNKGFTDLSTLKRHNLIHEGKKPFQCKICNKRFTQLATLRTHNLIHEGKKYQCKFCNKSFTDLSTLKRHNLIHEGKKPFQCKICNKRFTQLATLRTHNLIHEGKKYQCKVCDKSFTHSSAVEIHNLIHEGEKPHQCKVCDKRFTHLSTLRCHILVHEG